MEEEGSNFTGKQQESNENKSKQFDKSIIHATHAKTLFNKHFSISDIQKIEYTLPEPESMFTVQSWQLDNLQVLKNNLNRVKNRLNNFNLDEWQRHTYQMNKAGDVLSCVKKYIQPEFVTQAWCKFYEIVCNFPLVPLNEISHNGNNLGFISVHLCEAPGAFVIALNHWLKLNAHHLQWDWIANTLNPYCEGNPYSQMVDDDRFIRHTLRHWCFGADNTGNLMDLKNLDVLVEKSNAAGGGPIMLVTADGSIDCTDLPGEQENTVAHLHLCETIACMHLLQKGGSFLLKVFTLFEQQSVCLMYLLSCIFHQVTMTKPATSKAGNSEMYVVCVNFKGRDYVAPYLSILRQHYNTHPAQAMFDSRYIPNCFMQKIEDCSKFFMYYQCEVIEDNISAFHSDTYNEFLLELREIRRKIGIMYFKSYKLKRINPMDEIVGRKIIEKSNSYIMTRKMCHDSYNDRCKRQDLEPRERLQQIWSIASEIELSIERLHTWNLQALPETLEIRTGRLFHKIHSSRFCEAKILQILNEVNKIIDDMHFTICFPSEELMKKRIQLINSTNKILIFQFIHIYDSHRMITEVYDQLKKLQAGETLILVNYPLLTQLNVSLLYILGNSFDKVTIEIHDHEGYRIKLETYQHNKKVINHLHEIFTVSYVAHKENMAIWSVMPMTILYEWNQYQVIMQLNHLVIKLYISHAIDTIDKT